MLLSQLQRHSSRHQSHLQALCSQRKIVVVATVEVAVAVAVAVVHPSDYDKFQKCLSDAATGGSATKQQIKDCFDSTYGGGSSSSSSSSGNTDNSGGSSDTGNNPDNNNNKANN